MKKWWKSKTIWLSALTGALGISQALMDSGLLSATATGYALISVAVLSAALRFITTEAIK